MYALHTLLFIVVASSTLLAADSPPPAVITKAERGNYELTTSTRTNGCRLELSRYIKTQANMQGYWLQNVFVGKKHLATIQHFATQNERSLVFDQDTGFGILQLDRDLDGKYEMLIVTSIKDQGLVDVLFVTDDGSLRHSTSEEFDARLHIAQGNRRAIEKLNQIISDGANEANKELKK